MGSVIVLGSLMTDLVARAERLPLAGESLLGLDFGTYVGGKGCNQATAVARLGIAAGLIGRVGADAFGAEFARVLAAEGIVAQVSQDKATGTGVACILLDARSGQNVIVALPRANLTLTGAAVERALTTLLATLPEPRVFLTQCETSLAATEAGLRVARAAGLRTILNVAPIPREPLADATLALADVLVVNEVEAASLARRPVADRADAEAAAEALLARGPAHIVVTLGAQGAIWSTREGQSTAVQHTRVPPFPITAQDATAAGDAFCGALAAALAQGEALPLALRQASAAGALAASHMGALPSLPTAAEVATLLASASDEADG